MKVRIERSGGVTGIGRVFELDAALLEPAKAIELAAHVAAARTVTTSPPPARPAGADRFTFRITVEADGASFALTVSEEAASPAIAALIAWVLANAR